jgi:hypothetical protein
MTGAVRRIGSTNAPAIQGELKLVHSKRPGVRVLFIGNSLTAANSMIGMESNLAASSSVHAKPIFAVEYAPGGSTLTAAGKDPTLVRLLESNRWNDVVLQENSYPAELYAYQGYDWMAGAQALAPLIRRSGARTVLFETWGFRDGDQVNWPDDTYDQMQTRLHASYRHLGSALQAFVTPVGDAWRAALKSKAGLDLWASDGVHPSKLGSYLAACVLYGALDGDSPLASRYTAGLDAASAQWLRRMADAQLLASWAG